MQWQNRWKSLLDPVLKLGVGSFVKSKGSGIYSSFGVTEVPVPNLSVDITPRGKFVLISLQPDIEQFPNDVEFTGTPGIADTQCLATLSIYRDSTKITEQTYAVVAVTPGSPFRYATSPGVSCIDSPPPNVPHTYIIRLSVDFFSLPFSVNNWVLTAQEL